MNKRFYLAYGSNLNQEQMKRRCPQSRVIGTGVIENHRLLFKGSKTGAYLTIEPKDGRQVPIAVWEVTEKDERSLDRYEGFPSFYFKVELELWVEVYETGSLQLIKAFVYIMRRDSRMGLPTLNYFKTCYHGYQSFGFDDKFLRQAYADSKEGVLWGRR